MKRDPNRIALSDQHNAKGIELADHGMFDEAIREFNKAIELDPESAHAHDNLATVLTDKKQFREALDEYLIAIRLEPDSPTAHYNLACFLSIHGAELAIEEFRETLDLEPDYPDARLNLGLTYADTNQLEEAKREFNLAIAQNAQDGFARHELAALLMEEGDFRGAISQLKEVTRLEPDSFEAHLDLGICFAQKGFYAEAEKAYARATALTPDDLLLLYNSAALYALWGRPEAALAQLGKAILQDAEKVRAWLSTDPMFDALKSDPAFEATVFGA